ncbi:OmpA family protein [Robiginitalea marina]|uniref:OmpA family protein n=1 Tax=Robiginitalea marina TaxID=2954105 RepID=A0ABT1B3E0_9FLAO|nr:OmpA family protein [Robiginitalea marina]MCO5725938.1 OmpA family protein [Robiginitalea marina]
MRTPLLLKSAFVVALLLTGMPEANGQFLEKLAKRAERAAERTVERRVDREVSKKTDQALDSILEPGKDKGKSKTPGPGKNGGEPAPENGSQTPKGTTETSGPKTLEVYSKFDFVPGDKVLFFDDYSNDFIGDFPARWNTNGSGEVVRLGDSPERWLRVLRGNRVMYIPDVPDLPDDYTIEFDLMVNGIDKQTSSTAGFTLTLSDTKTFDTDGHWARVFLPLGQYGAFDIRLRNFVPGEGNVIASAVSTDIRQAVLNRPHISIAVNGSRFRLWVNETKYVDVPRFIPEGSAFKALKFDVDGIKDGKEDVFITNLKVAEGGVDLRRKLLSEGSISTNGILFDSGSANLQPRSMGIILQIAQVLQQDAGIKLRIEGHTDSDGETAANQKLSEARAEAVKKALIDVYGVDAGRLSTLGKGESEPVAANDSPDGKAQNRRVVFIRQ